MKTVLTKGLEKDEQGLFRQEFKATAFMRKQISKVLQDKIEAARVGMRDKDVYNSPSWAFTQADAIGYERALKELISLLEN